MKIYEIVKDKLYVSPKTNGVPLSEKLPLLKQYNIDTIVNLWHTEDKELVDEMYEYVHFHQPERKNPDDIDLDAYVEMARTVVDMINDGHIVLAHCYGGRNRSGLLACIVIMFLKNVNGKEAREYFMKKRPGALNDKSYREILGELKLL